MVILALKKTIFVMSINTEFSAFHILSEKYKILEPEDAYKQQSCQFEVVVFVFLTLSVRQHNHKTILVYRDKKLCLTRSTTATHRKI